jgi:peptidoglycan/xylan/chitin deacetylase (PgdA/CDA1 family)
MDYIHRKILGLFVKTNGILSQRVLGGIGHIFMLHRVLPEKLRNQYSFNRSLAITPEFLESTILYLKKKEFNFISLDELYAILQTGKKPKKKFICITLDDGYKDNLIYGYPVFKKHNIPFTIYVTNCFPNYTANLYWYWLEEELRKNDKMIFNNTNYSLYSENDKALAYSNISSIIKKSDQSKRVEYTRNIFGKDKQIVAEELKQIALSWDELKQLNAIELANIGAHTMNHLTLANLDKTEMGKEISFAKSEMESKLGTEPDHFAYPYGGLEDAGNREYLAASKNGFKTATINYPGNIFTGHRNFTMSLPRYPLSDSTKKENFDFFLNGIRHFSANQFRKIIKY